MATQSETDKSHKTRCKDVYTEIKPAGTETVYSSEIRRIHRNMSHMEIDAVGTTGFINYIYMQNIPDTKVRDV